MTEAQRKALEILAQTHVYLTVEGAYTIQDAFGMLRHVQRCRANTGDFKGLEVGGVEPGTIVEGYASHDLADAIAGHLGLPGSFLQGRGSRQRDRVTMIRKYLEPQK